LNFVDGISKNTEISKLMKIRPVEIELFFVDEETDGRSDIHNEANSCFLRFC